jgi:hypothetical protein
MERYSGKWVPIGTPSHMEQLHVFDVLTVAKENDHRVGFEYRAIRSDCANALAPSKGILH